MRQSEVHDICTDCDNSHSPLSRLAALAVVESEKSVIMGLNRACKIAAESAQKVSSDPSLNNLEVAISWIQALKSDAVDNPHQYHPSFHEVTTKCDPKVNPMIDQSGNLIKSRSKRGQDSTAVKVMKRQKTVQ
jgi:hypothetical protein